MDPDRRISTVMIVKRISDKMILLMSMYILLHFVWQLQPTFRQAAVASRHYRTTGMLWRRAMERTLHVWPNLSSITAYSNDVSAGLPFDISKRSPMSQEKWV
jgi:hypothetical protein